MLVSHLQGGFGAVQEHFADRALSLPTEPKPSSSTEPISQAPVHSERSPVKLSPDQISNLHDSKNSGHSMSLQVGSDFLTYLAEL